VVCYNVVVILEYNPNILQHWGENYYVWSVEIVMITVHFHLASKSTNNNTAQRGELIHLNLIFIASTIIQKFSLII